MARRILVIQAHPDSKPGHFGPALAERYAAGARRGGHDVEVITVADLHFPLLRSKEEWGEGLPPDDIRAAQAKIARADHLVIVYPLWLGTIPALLKAFLEQVFRPGFAISEPQPGKTWHRLLVGKSARVVVTMGMPGLAYRWFYRAHSLKSLKRNILHFVGITPVRSSVVGNVEGMSRKSREGWLKKMDRLGEAAD